MKRTLHRVRRATWIGLALLVPGTALAQGVGIDRTHPAVDVTTDLESARAGDRLLAARELLRRVRGADRRAARARDPLTRREAEIERHDACADSAPALRRSVVAFRDVRRALAQVAAICGDPDTLPAVEAARAAETRASVQRRLDAAIALLGAP